MLLFQKHTNNMHSSSISASPEATPPAGSSDLPQSETLLGYMSTKRLCCTVGGGAPQRCTFRGLDCQYLGLNLDQHYKTSMAEDFQFFSEHVILIVMLLMLWQQTLNQKQ